MHAFNVYIRYEPFNNELPLDDPICFLKWTMQQPWPIVRQQPVQYDFIKQQSVLLLKSSRRCEATSGAEM